MNRLPIFFGYAGAIPFILFMLLTFAMPDARSLKVLTILQLCYGAMILSFLGGVHWGQAIPSGNKQQLSFAMFPTVSCFILLVLAFFTTAFIPLILMAALFWVVFAADKKLMPLDYIPEGYFKYRRNLTLIVSTTLLISALISL